MSPIVIIKLFCNIPFLLLISAALLIISMEAYLDDKKGKSAATEKREFFLYPQKLDALFHRAATMALLKAKAVETLEAVPNHLERIVFGECVKDGGTQSPAKYAACLVKLFRARGEIGKNNNKQGEQKELEKANIEGEQSIFGETMNLIKNLANQIKPKTPNLSNEMTLKRTNLENKIETETPNADKEILPKLVPKRRLIKKKKGRKKLNRNKWKGKKLKLKKKKKAKPQFWIKRRRIRRELDPKLRLNLRMPKSIGALKELQKYLDRLEWAQNYLGTMSQDSAKALKPFLAQPIQFVQTSSSSAVLPLLSQIQSILNASNKTDLSFSLLSPRLLSLFPATKSKPKLLSPDLFSFNRNGILSLPQLFGMITRGDESESLEWLDFMLELTGAGKQLAALLEKMRPEMEEFEQKIWPAIERLRAQEKQWNQLKSSFGAEQQEQLAKRGYVQLEKWQQEIIFGKKETDQMEEERRLGLEAKIVELAKLANFKGDKKLTMRVRRESEDDWKKEEEKDEEGMQIRIQRESNEVEDEGKKENEEKNEENIVKEEKVNDEENGKKNEEMEGDEKEENEEEERKRRHGLHEVSNVVEHENDNTVRVSHHERDGFGGIGPPRPLLGGPSLIGANGIYPPVINPIGGGLGMNPAAAAAATIFPNNPFHNNLLYRHNLFPNGQFYPHNNVLFPPNGFYPNNNPFLYPNNFGFHHPFFPNNPFFYHNRFLPCHSPGSCVIGGQETNLFHPFPHRRYPQNVPGGKSPDTMDSILMAPRTVLLTPWAFEQRLGGVILEGVYLSPHAFSSELVSPEVLTAKVASPSAFMAAILSPMALTARIVSPTAFRSQILSPEALSAYVLSPDVFLAEILSPNVMQARVLSPKALFVQILNPTIASPRIGSPQIGGLVVLSPNFLSPRIYSQESLMVEVLSPHILGGEHEVIEADRWMPDGSTHYVGFPGQIQGPLDLQNPNWG